MRLAEIVTEPQPVPFWKMLKQIDVDEVVGILPRRSFDWRETHFDLPWSYAPLAVYKEMIEGEGFRLAAIEDNPPMDAIRYGRAGRDEEIEQICTLIRNMGRLGIPVWCYNWAAGLGWLRTSSTRLGRGGALVSEYDHELLDHSEPPLQGPIDEEPLWDNLHYFLERVLPVAEEAGVKLAMHPDDPPLSPIRGVGRIMRSPEAFQRMIELVPSEANGVTLCQGNFGLMNDDIPSMIRQFGEQDKIFYVHFRDVRGTPQSFVETFHDEGQTDMLACMRAYRECGFDGVMRSDHVPLMEGDGAQVTGYSVLGRLYAIGYMTGLREAALADHTAEHSPDPHGADAQY